ncbi:MAG: 1-acyl-sn-glycerol-3-phosphate acyltransferase [Clostridia bacterium]|nr:1-acyl-sn-glycerol-3-phosphate acyltransferase [Clostridia bacterium]
MAKKEKKQKKDGSRSYRVIYAIFAGLVGRIFRIRVIGGEKEPDKGGFLVCANHIAASDAVILCYAFRKHQVHLMAKKELFKIPLLSSLIRFLGAFPIDRGGNDVGAIKKGVNFLKEGQCMGMFPQGHRHPGEDPRKTPLKNGAALISTRAGADVVPVFIKRKNNTPRLFRKTYVIIGDPIPYESFGYDPEATGEYARITGVIFDRICTLGEEFVDPKEAKKKEKES